LLVSRLVASDRRRRGRIGGLHAWTWRGTHGERIAATQLRLGSMVNRNGIVRSSGFHFVSGGAAPRIYAAGQRRVAEQLTGAGAVRGQLTLHGSVDQN
jgi:hypothetical protein